MEANNLRTGVANKNNFSLIETILWEKGSFYLLDLHIERLAESAAFFAFPYDKTPFIKELSNITPAMKKDRPYRVRLLLEKNGNIKVEYAELDNRMSAPSRAILSDKKVDSLDVFLRHKTTKRLLYDNEHLSCVLSGFFDVLFLNEKKELTEGAITNIVLKKGNKHFTPPLECGLLGGVYRRHLLDTKAFGLKEKVLYADDLYSADEVLLINSVRKVVPVVVAR